MKIFSPSIIYGENPFFNSTDYKENLSKEFNSIAPVCTYQSSQTIQKRENSFPPFPFPTFKYLMKRIARNSLLPAQKAPATFGTTLASETTPWKYKRVTILADRLSIDAALMGRPSSLKNKKWALISIGRTEKYEDTITSAAFRNFLEKIDSNAIIFNYPKMGKSIGTRNAQNLVTAYKAVLEFLEDDKKGIGAKKIIGYGYSMGGGVQGESLKNYPFKLEIDQGIEYLFIKDRTFSSLERVVNSFTKGLFGWIVPYYGLSLSSIESSQRLHDLRIPEIIIQTTDDQKQPISDGVISKNASLKNGVLTLSSKYKYFINLVSPAKNYVHGHSIDPFSDLLSKRINQLI